MVSFERSPSHRGSERTSCGARWHDDALVEIDAPRRPTRPEAIRRLIKAEVKAKRGRAGECWDEAEAKFGAKLEAAGKAKGTRGNCFPLVQ